MNLQTVKNLRNREGFTLVELLIVIVVIAILAAITIVAYNGVQNKAHTTAANSAATEVIKKAALYQTENQSYPTALSVLQGVDQDDPAYLPASDAVQAASGKFATDTGLLNAKPTGDDADKTVNYQVCGTDAGAIVSYWDFSGSSAKSLSTGDVSGCS